MLYKIYELVQKMKNNGINVIELNTGDPDIKSVDVIENIKKYCKPEYLTYCSAKGDFNLLESIKNLWKISDEKDVLIIPGSKYGIWVTIKLNRNKKFSLIEPYWSAYEMMLKEWNCRYEIIRLDLENKTVDPKNISGDIIIINNPNNPTSYKIENLDEIIEYCNKKNIEIIYDAAYEEVSYYNKKIDPSSVDYYIYSFSKTFGISGARIGWVSYPKEMDEKYIKEIQTNLSCVPLFIQKGVNESLKNKKKIIESIKKEYMKRSIEGYNLLSEYFEVQKPDAPFYIYPKVGKSFDYFELLEKNKVAVVPGVSFGKNQEEYIRIALVGKKWKEGIEKIIEYKKEISK